MSEIMRGHYDNGQLRYEIPYNQDQVCGVQKGWHKNGQPKYEAPYHQSKRHGISKYWYEDGYVSDIRYHLYDEQVSEEEYRKYELIEKLACLK